MEFAPAGVSLSFEVTFDRNDLFVGMSVFDDSGSLPVLLLSPFAMLNVVGNTYRGKFANPEPGKSYIIFKAVYTDDTFTELDNNYSQGSESIKAEYLNNASGCAVVGFVDNNNTVVGLVNC
jgi:hypothetical protein